MRRVKYWRHMGAKCGVFSQKKRPEIRESCVVFRLLRQSGSGMMFTGSESRNSAALRPLKEMVSCQRCYLLPWRCSPD